MKIIRVKCFANNKMYNITSDTLEDFRNKLLIQMELDNEFNVIILIYNGSTIRTDKQFNELQSNETIIVIPGNKPKPKEVVLPTIESIASIPESSNVDKTYTFDQIYGSLFVLFSFVNSNPKLKHMFENRFEDFINFMRSDDFRKLSHEIIDNSDMVVDAIRENRDIFMEVQHQGTGIDSATVNNDDYIEVQKIKDMGYTELDALSAYLKNNRDADKAITSLYESKQN